MKAIINEADNNKPSLKSSVNWLQRLKDESWEAELLVSTISIFGTFQMFDFIGWVANTFINLLNPSQYMLRKATR